MFREKSPVLLTVNATLQAQPLTYFAACRRSSGQSLSHSQGMAEKLTLSATKDKNAGLTPRAR